MPEPSKPKPKVEELKRTWKTFNIYSEDPMQKYFFEMDYQMGGMTYDEYWRNAQSEDPKKLTSLLFESWKWRADSRNNVVMCLSPNTKIIINNREIELEKQFKKNPFINILSYNFKNKQTEFKKAEIKKSTKKQLFEISLEDGRKANASKNHRFFVKHLAGFVEKKLSELKEGDEIAVLD